MLRPGQAARRLPAGAERELLEAIGPVEPFEGTVPGSVAPAARDTDGFRTGRCYARGPFTHEGFEGVLMARNNDRSRGSKRAPAAASLRPRRGKPKVCIFCRDSIPWVDYKDANLLGRFLSERAKIKARRTTGQLQPPPAGSSRGHQDRSGAGPPALRQAHRRRTARRSGRSGRWPRRARWARWGSPREDREEQTEAPAAVEEAVAEATDVAAEGIEDLETDPRTLAATTTRNRSLLRG